MAKIKQPTKSTNKPKPRPRISYVPSAPAAMGAVDRGKKAGLPVMTMRGPTTILRNYEQVAAFPTGNAAFQASGAITNPGIAGSFPWLAAIAANYSKFRFRYLRFFFSGSCPTSTTGKVWINISYDPIDTTPSTLAQVMQSEDSCSGPAWFGGVVSNEKAFDRRLPADSNIFVDVDCKRFSLPWYVVRSSTTTVGVSLSGAPTGGIGTLILAGSTIDPSAVPCRLYFGNNGVTASTVPGELYVAYEVELIEPLASALAV
jgi:hypothetical protein